MTDIYLTFSTSQYLFSAQLQRLFVEALGGRHMLFTEKHLPREMLLYCTGNKRGFGYWRWKPYLISLVLDCIGEKDRLFWVDSGILPLKSLESLTFESMYIQNNVFSDPRAWCKPILEDKLPNATSFFLEGGVPDAAFIGFRKNRKSLAFVREWYALCCDHGLLSDDFGSDEFSSHPRFVEHRHDQSLLGYVSMRNCIEYMDPITQYGQNSFYLFHHRKKIRNPVELLFILVLWGWLRIRCICGLNQSPMIRLQKRYLYR
jgi:hypothetical protein